MAYKEGGGIRCEVIIEVKGGELTGKMICQKLKDGKDDGKPLTELVSIPGTDEGALSILGGRLKVNFVEAFDCFHN